MKLTHIRSLVAAIVFGTAASAHAAHAGAVDFGAFAPAAGKQYVEVNLKPALIKFAAKIVAVDEPEAAELLRSIHGVRVHVVGVEDSNRESTTAQITQIRADLAAAGWENMATVREATDGADGDDVAVFVKTGPEDSIAGVVVTVMSGKGEAVLVNIVGNIKAEQIVTVAEKLDIKPLRELKLKQAKADKAV
ncbi:MAG: DUF4252 domain-containing protein [Opitutaceae bacterium]|nr:DUF4252 domain-containing protein [Opitutaceae bacterium]